MSEESRGPRLRELAIVVLVALIVALLGVVFAGGPLSELLGNASASLPVR